VVEAAKKQEEEDVAKANAVEQKAKDLWAKIGELQQGDDEYGDLPSIFLQI